MSRVIDYGGRISKDVTRQIFVEVLKRIQLVEDMAEYSYVGFGAHQFLDFNLVHRKLGIKNMVSIESNEELIQRCHFNTPYKGIEIHSGTATTVIPGLDWSSKAIVWLDYTQRLRRSELADCENVALRLQPGSVLAVTLNCHSGKFGQRCEDLETAVGADAVPLAMNEAKLGEWGLAKTQREMFSATMHRTLAARGDGTSWEQILNIHYRDDARMQLLVGVIGHPSVRESIRQCRYEDMNEVSTDAEPLIVEIPQLTVRERHAIDKKLPAKSLKEFAGIPAEELAKYARFYRWLDPVG